MLLGKTQVIDVLQGEVDGRDLQIKVSRCPTNVPHKGFPSLTPAESPYSPFLPQELMERLRRLQVERESLASRMEAEKHVMRAQLRDLMDKQQAEAQRLSKEHQEQLAQSRQDLLVQLEELRSASTAPPAGEEASRKQLDDSGQTVAELEGGTESIGWRGWEVPVSCDRLIFRSASFVQLRLFHLCSAIEAENGGGQQVRGQVPENQGVV